MKHGSETLARLAGICTRSVSQSRAKGQKNYDIRFERDHIGIEATSINSLSIDRLMAGKGLESASQNEDFIAAAAPGALTVCVAWCLARAPSRLTACRLAGLESALNQTAVADVRFVGPPCGLMH